MYQPKSLLEAYYSIYQPKPLLDEEIYNIVIDYLLENFEFADEKHLHEMIELLDENMIDEILAETAEKGHPDIKGQEDFQRRVEAEMARRRAARAKKESSKEEKKEEPKKEEELDRNARYERLRKQAGVSKKEPEKKEEENPLRKTTINRQGSTQQKKGPDLPNFRR